MANCWWMFLSEWSVVFTAGNSLLHVAGLTKHAANFNAAVVYPISIICAIENLTVLLLGNGLNSLIELKSTKTPVSTRNRQVLIVVEALYFSLLLNNYAQQKTWPYGFLESAGPVNFLFVTVPVHMILVDALQRGEE